jgi:hypothetical protein
MELVSLYRAGASETDLGAAMESLMERFPEDPMLQYAHTRLLASARDPGLRQPERALELANRLALSQPILPHQRLQTVALAAAGDFAQAAQIQQQLVAMSAWTASPEERKILQQEMEAFESGRLPAEPWPKGDVLLSPPPFDPIAPFRDYPAAVPY